MKIPRFILDLLYPRKAVCMACGSMLGCGQNDVCEDCREQLAADRIGARAVEKRLLLDGAAFAHHYHGPAGGMVRSLKYRGVKLLTEEMGADVAKAAESLRMENIAAVTCVPMHIHRKNMRGFNHAELLARAAADNMNLPYAELLYRTRNAPQQARLDRKQRLQNLKDVFAVRAEALDAVKGANILLIDDVMTTGATAMRCSEALRRAGAKHVYFAAYATGMNTKRRKQNGKDKQHEKSPGAAAPRAQGRKKPSYGWTVSR